MTTPLDSSSKTYGFIIVRHVNSEITNRYWNQSVSCIQKHYPGQKIVVIDDNSDQTYVKAEMNYHNVTFIQSEYPGRGELLPYYYFHKHHFFDHAVIIHDSVFFHKKVDFEKILHLPVAPLWYFRADQENVDNSIRIVKHLKNNENIVKQLTNTDNMIMRMSFLHTKWAGCFGVMSWISYSLLDRINKEHDLFQMLRCVTCRKDRCCLERIMGVLFILYFPNLTQTKCLFGNINGYLRWGYTFQEYEIDVKKNKLPKKIIKVWTGR